MNKFYWVIIVFLILLFVFLFLKVDKLNFPVSWDKGINIVKDTFYIERYYAPDTVLITKPKIIYRQKNDTVKIKDVDTIYIMTGTEGFVAEDSLITKKQDTFKIQFFYPEAYFRYSINYSPDTIKQVQVKINKEEKKWIEYIEYGAIGCALGIIIGSLIK
jgi:hypothetical protein